MVKEIIPNMKKFTVLIMVALLALPALAQKISKGDLKQLKVKEDSLGILSWRTANELSAKNRFRADSFFIKVFVRSLVIKNSFEYKFDSLLIAKAYSPDSTFRIFTWQVDKNKDTIRQRGVIQYRTADGSLKLTPLIDNSEFAEDLFAVGNNRSWIGAIYYRILKNEFQGKKYYTLIGWDENNSKSNKKWVDMLTFNDNGEPVFGGPYFKMTDAVKNRFGLEYKKEVSVRLMWDEDQQMIVFDHLTPEGGFVNQRSTYVPDGDYEGFKWENGYWVFQPKIMCNCPLSKEKFDPMLGKPPIEDPLFDKQGNRNEEKLIKKSGGQ
jgi:hypothetical protein